MIIPDSIEPYLGYKALNIVFTSMELEPDSVRLSSPRYAHLWPVKERLEAACVSSLSHWQWTPIEGQPREVDAMMTLPGVQQPGGTTAIFAMTSSAIGTVGPLKRPPVPNNPLPPGWNWSWEPLTHDVPEESCHCGIYVASTPEGCMSYLQEFNSVIAQIALWGKVIPAASGARGQYAYPRAILAPLPVADQLQPVATLYGSHLAVMRRATDEELQSLGDESLIIRTRKGEWRSIYA